QSDETNTLRSLFQLSYIPPNERDPARFRKLVSNRTEFNGEEFAKFCQKYPQLVHRLRTGMRRESLREQKRQFTCERPEDVVQFLADNQNLPSSYALDGAFTPPGRAWEEKPDELLPRREERYPVLPPKRAVKAPQLEFDPDALTSASPLTDDVDAYLASEAGYAYAQEPIPEPDKLPGSTKEITDRAPPPQPPNA